MKKPIDSKASSGRDAADDRITPLGAEIAESLEELRDALREERPLAERFPVRTVQVEAPKVATPPDGIRSTRKSGRKPIRRPSSK